MRDCAPVIGCGCSCHRWPNVKHFVACCDAPPFKEKPVTTAVRPSYIYVASSWRNAMQPAVIEVLKAAGLDHYDFRNPAEGDTGFAWADVGLTDPCSAVDYLAGIEHPLALDGFSKDMAAMEKADTFVLILPCGRSAHLELGWAVGAGKRTAILLDDAEAVTPELMYRMCDYVAPDLFSLLGWLGVED